jgi:hypothetical protein
MILAAVKIMNIQTKAKAESSHGVRNGKKKMGHLPLYCTTDRRAMVLISLKPMKLGHSKS